MTFVGSAVRRDQFPRDGLPEVAFLGRSNVGKSSLLNALARSRNLARVSAQPGRTQTVNFFRVGNEMYLADLPGYGYARVPEAVRAGWEQIVTTYLTDRAPLALCLFLVDARHEPSEGDQTLREWLGHFGFPYVVAATKADKLGQAELSRRLKALRAGIGRAARDVIAVSAEDRTGIEELWGAMRRATATHQSATH